MQAHVLIVEDDPILRDRIARSLAEYEVSLAEDGEAAIEFLWNRSFDAIVLDLMLPRLSGYDVIRHLTMRTPELLRRTIITTGAVDGTLTYLQTEDVFALLRKPFALEELNATLVRLLEQ
jgi:DNA-binding response OmpR family regulator